MSRAFCTALLLLSLALPSTASANLFEHPGAQVSLKLPKGWTSDVHQDILMTASPQEDVFVLLVVLDNREASTLQAALDKHIGEVVTEARAISAPERIQRHGLKGVSARATGAFEGAPVEIRTMAIEVGTNKTFLVVAFLKDRPGRRLEQQLRDLFQSIRPL